MTKFFLAALALIGLISFAGVSAEACNGSLTDDSKSCDPRYDDNQSTNEAYCRWYGRAYDLGKTCQQYGYQTPVGSGRPGGQQRIVCEYKDGYGKRYRVLGTTRKAKDALSKAMQYCYSQSSSPRTCYQAGCNPQ